MRAQSFSLTDMQVNNRTSAKDMMAMFTKLPSASMVSERPSTTLKTDNFNQAFDQNEFDFEIIDNEDNKLDDSFLLTTP